jgi:F-type H+-transporting ATPase subunit a
MTYPFATLARCLEDEAKAATQKHDNANSDQADSHLAQADHDHAADTDQATDHDQAGAADHQGHDVAPEISPEDWTAQHQQDYYLHPDHLIGHAQDSDHFVVPNLNPGSETFLRESVELKIPNPLGFTDEHPMIAVPPNDFLGSVSFAPTKFIVLELLAAVLLAVVFISLGRKIKSGAPVKGRFWNMLEAGVVFVRDDIARPSIGSKDADQFLPFLWTIFFFVLAMNLIGMVPMFGAATSSLSITASLALVVFGVVLYTGMKKMGVVGFWKAQAPHMDLPGPLKYTLVPMIWAIEVFGLFIKHLVLAVRLFANMFAGHLVLAVFVAFIGVAWSSSLLTAVVVPGSVFGSVGISLLELLVAFIQAYVFAFLSALFIGAAVHPH